MGLAAGRPDAYERAWRTAGTELLTQLFTDDASYAAGPYEPPRTGRHEIAEFWEAERDGPDDVFELAWSPVAIEGDTAVVRAEVRYGDPPGGQYRDLWVIRLGEDGRCSWFEEWPYWPGEPNAPDG